MKHKIYTALGEAIKVSGQKHVSGVKMLTIKIGKESYLLFERDAVVLARDIMSVGYVKVGK